MTDNSELPFTILSVVLNQSNEVFPKPNQVCYVTEHVWMLLLCIHYFNRDNKGQAHYTITEPTGRWSTANR